MHLTQSFTCKSQGPIDPAPELCVSGCWFAFTPRGRQFWSSSSPWTGSFRWPQWLLLSTPSRKISPPRTVAFPGGLQPVATGHKHLGGHIGKVAQQWGLWETWTHLCASCCGWFVLKRTDSPENGEKREVNVLLTKSTGFTIFKRKLKNQKYDQNSFLNEISRLGNCLLANILTSSCKYLCPDV